MEWKVSPAWRWVLGIAALFMVAAGFGLYVLGSHLTPIVKNRALDMPVSYTHLTLPTILRV